MASVRGAVVLAQRSVPNGLERLVCTRWFGSKKVNGDDNLSYDERKALKKERRRELYNKKMDRLASLQDRRSSSPKDVKKSNFRSYFDVVRKRDEALDRKARRLGLEWRVVVSGVVERLPVVMPDMPEWETDYIEMKAQLDAVSGKQYPPEFLNAGSQAAEEEQEVAGYVTNEEIMEMLKEQGYTPLPRETEADETGDVRTLDRELKTRVYLAILPSSSSSSSSQKWSFPTVEAQQNETLLAAAKRSITSSIGTDLEFWCPSNCPLGVHMQPYTPEEQQQHGYFGVKNFFIKVQLDEGDVDVRDDKVVQDWAWFTREEMAKKVLEEQGEDSSKFYHYLL